MHARRLPAQPVQRAVAVIWDMHVFINQLIECEISFKRTFYMNWNFEFLFCNLAAWHEVEQNKCKHDPQLSHNNKIRDSFNEVNFKDGCCERCGKPRRGCPHFLDPHLMYTALASNLFLTSKLSAVRL